MKKESKKIALEKFLNSSFIISIYPMIERIEVTELDEDNGSLKYNVYLNVSDIEYKNMYETGLDPHYLNDHHVKEALNFFSLKIPNRSFDVYKKNGDYLVGFRDKKNMKPLFFKGVNGMKTVDLI